MNDYGNIINIVKWLNQCWLRVLATEFIHSSWKRVHTKDLKDESGANINLDRTNSLHANSNAYSGQLKLFLQPYEIFDWAIKIVHINVLNRFMSRQEITSGIRQGSADWMEHWNVINPILPSSWFGHLSKTNSNGRIRSGLGLEQPWKYL